MTTMINTNKILNLLFIKKPLHKSNNRYNHISCLSLLHDSINRFIESIIEKDRSNTMQYEITTQSGSNNITTNHLG